MSIISKIGLARRRVKALIFVGFSLWIFAFVTIFQNRTKIAHAVVAEKHWPDLQDVFSSSSREQVAVSTSGARRNVSVTSLGGHSSYGHCQSDDFRHVHTADKTSLTYFTGAFKLTQEPVSSWLTKETSFCDNNVKVYDNKFGLLHNVKINPRERNNADGVAKGGEGVEEVKSQHISKEDYVFKQGFYEIVCKNANAAAASASNSAFDKLKQLKVVEQFDSGTSFKTEETFTIAIVRGDYANLWNHMFELYSVFLVMAVFNKQPQDVSVLFLDGHPSCLLDKNWEHIFGPVQRVGRFPEPVVYKSLVLGLAENQTPLSKWENPSCPYVEEFRTFVLNQYGIAENAKQLNCHKLTFTFIVRRNQVYHPRNLEGNVQRKIFNELDVIETLMDRFPGVCIQALLMESIPMRAQLEIVSETDVLIGMHGAGMMHTIFLPRHAGVVELFPRDWRKTRKHAIMYEKMSVNWRGLKYGSWQNPDPKRAFNERVTIVDTNKVFEEVQTVINQMCHSAG